MKLNRFEDYNADLSTFEGTENFMRCFFDTIRAIGSSEEADAEFETFKSIMRHLFVLYYNTKKASESAEAKGGGKAKTANSNDVSQQSAGILRGVVSPSISRANEPANPAPEKPPREISFKTWYGERVRFKLRHKKKEGGK